MSTEQLLQLDVRMQQAVDELKGTIALHYPMATFELSRAADDPHSIHLLTVVDVDDPDDVGDLVVERVVELQSEEQVPIHVIPVRTPERVLASREAQQETRSRRRVAPILGRLP